MASGPFAAQIRSLDSKQRKEPDKETKQRQLNLLAHLRNGLDRPHALEQIERQSRVMDGTYHPPEANWLKEAKARLDAKR